MERILDVVAAKILLVLRESEIDLAHLQCVLDFLVEHVVGEASKYPEF